VITLELPHAGIMPTREQISELWTDLVHWLIVNVQP
jgi:murein peptide amidase A